MNVLEVQKQKELAESLAQAKRINELLNTKVASKNLPSRLPPIKRDKSYLDRAITPDVALPRKLNL